VLAAVGAVGVAASVFALFLVDGVREHGDLTSHDASVTASVVADRTGVMTVVANAFTFVGSEVSVGVLTAALLGWMVIRHRAWRAAWIVGGSMGLAGLVTMALKHLVLRARPPAVDVLGAIDTGYSFPSGHTLYSTVFCGLVAGLLVVRSRVALARIGVVAAWVLMSAGVGLSRIYLGYHWLTDVVAGWSLALVILAVAAAATVMTSGHRVVDGADAASEVLGDGARSPQPNQV
jgi:undecaprenyl-diphosphatase